MPTYFLEFNYINTTIYIAPLVTNFILAILDFTLDLTICHLVTISGNVLSCFSSAICPLYSRSLIQISLLRSICKKIVFMLVPNGTYGNQRVNAFTLEIVHEYKINFSNSILTNIDDICQCYFELYDMLYGVIWHHVISSSNIWHHVIWVMWHHIIIIIIIWVGDTATVSHFTKCNTNSKVRALSRIRLPKQMCFQVFCKSIQARRGRPQISRQNIPTARTSHSKRSQSPVSPMTGTTMSQWAADLKADQPGTNKVLTQQSARYAWAKPCRHLNIIIHSLYVMRWGYGSQCKSTRAGVMWSNRFKPKIKRAAEFNTDWSCCMRDQGKHARTLLQKSNRLWTNACTNRSLDSTDKAFPKRRIWRSWK